MVPARFRERWTAYRPLDQKNSQSRLRHLANPKATALRAGRGQCAYTRESAATTLPTSPLGVKGFWINSPSEAIAPRRLSSSAE